jgi:hypothetical protein
MVCAAYKGSSLGRDSDGVGSQVVEVGREQGIQLEHRRDEREGRQVEDIEPDDVEGAVECDPRPGRVCSYLASISLSSERRISFVSTFCALVET